MARVKEYEGQRVVVGFETGRCMHAARCVAGLPEVFDVKRRPWVLPDAADPDAVIAQVAACPSGALTVRRIEGDWIERDDPTARISVERDGPLYLSGEVTITDPDGGEVCGDRRVALCRCGGTANPPFCDASHRDNGFSDD